MKKIVALTAALVLVIGTVSTVSAASWKTYFGLNSGWYEGTEAKFSGNASGWTCNILSIGWGGCWGGQISQKKNIVKGKKYTLKCTLSSSAFDKWVYIKIGNETGSQMNLGQWVDCKKGKSVSINKTFTAKYNANSIYFAVGGDFGDRAGVATDKDAKVRYKYAPNKKLDGRLPSDYSAEHKTTIKCTGFSLEEVSASTPSNGGTGNTDTNTGGGNVVNPNNNGTVTPDAGNTVSDPNTTVATGDFEPIVFGAAAVVAAAVIVVFTRRREAE